VAATRLVASLLFGVTKADPFTLATAAAILTIASLAAAWLLAPRCARRSRVHAAGMT
jgi:hypothetical protein